MGFNFQFDSVHGKSFIPHLIEAHRTNREISIVTNKNLSFDVDMPNDYIKLNQENICFKKGVFNEPIS